jgi:hypothetical protein
MEKEGSKETCTTSVMTSGLLSIDESKKVLGILYRAMKPLLTDFNPEMTCVYDECLRGILHDQYLQRASEVKAQYGSIFLKFCTLMTRY